MMTILGALNLWVRLACLVLIPFAALGVAEAYAQDATYSALDPRGEWPAIQRIPLSARLPDLQGKRVHLVRSWPAGGGFNSVATKLSEELKRRYPGAVVTIKDRNVRYSEDDPKLWAEMKANADAFVYLVAPSSSTTSYAFKWSAKLEQMGLPGTVVMYDTLLPVGETTRLREGAPVRFTAFSYPVETMSAADQQRAVGDVIDQLQAPLTAEERRTDVVHLPARPRIVATGTLDEIQRIFHEQGLTDGLPIIPPTEARVAAMLKGTSHAPDEMVSGAFMPESLKVTVRHVAINAVMAGSVPEHLPVLLATVEALGRYNLNSMLRSTNSFGFMQVVNGPIRQTLKMNAGVNAVGPGNHPNAVMGRALRLFITNLGGGEPGVNLMAVIGNNTNYSFLFAENEEESPWESLSASRGFSKDESTLTLFSGGWGHSGNYSEGMTLADVSRDIAAYQIPSGATVILSPPRAQALARQGLTRAQVKQQLWEKAFRPARELRGAPFRDARELVGKADDEMLPVFQPGTIEVVVAGGDGAPMMQAWHFYRPQTVSVDKWR